MAVVREGSFGELLKQYRGLTGLTQEELAERAGLSARGISDLERGVKQHPYPHTVQRLIQALGLAEDDASRFRQAARRSVDGRGPGLGAAEHRRQDTSLPQQPTTFIGRQQVVEETRVLLGREGVRLLTLTGPGGVGKTRLAVRIAEAAAAQVRLFPLQTLRQRLADRLHLLSGGPRDAPPRQQTLRSTIDWSYRLLTSEEQRVFARLSVFAGGCSLEAAEAVCNPEGELDLLAALGSLVDKCLVQQAGEDEPRFLMLETIKEYAVERLAAAREEARLGAAHAEYFCALAEEAERALAGPEQAVYDALSGPEQEAWLARLERENDNLRAALRWSLGAGRSLQLARELEDRRGIAISLRYLGHFAAERGKFEQAENLLDQSLRLRRDLEERWGVALTIHAAAVVATLKGEYERARGLYEESLHLLKELGDSWGIAHLSWRLGDLAVRQGDYGRAQELLEESRRLGEERRDRWQIETSLTGLSMVAEREGNNRRAQKLHEKAFRLMRDLRDKEAMVFGLIGLAAAACARCEHDRAAEMLGTAEANWPNAITPPLMSQRLEYVTEEARRGLGADAYEAAWNAGRAMPLDQVVACALGERTGGFENATRPDHTAVRAADTG